MPLGGNALTQISNYFTATQHFFSDVFMPNLKGKPYITISAKGLSNGLSTMPNDGADFGPDTTLGATSKNQTGGTLTQTYGIQEMGNSIPNDGLTYVCWVSPGIYYVDSEITLPNVLMVGNGIDTEIIANSSMTNLCTISAPSGYTYHHNGSIALQWYGNGKLTGYVLGINSTDIILQKNWIHGGVIGFKMLEGKGIFMHNYFEGNTDTGFSLGYSNSAGANASRIANCSVNNNYFQGNGQDLGIYGYDLMIYGNRFGDGNSNPWNIYIDQSYAIEIFGNVFHNPMLAGNNLYPLISINNSTEGGTSKNYNNTISIHDNIVTGLGNLPTYFVLSQTPSSGYVPIITYLKNNHISATGTGFVNDYAYFEEIYENSPFIVSSSSITAGTSPYTFPTQPYKRRLVLTTANGISALTLNGTSISISPNIPIEIIPTDTLIATWATTAPIFEEIPE